MKLFERKSPRKSPRAATAAPAAAPAAPDSLDAFLELAAVGDAEMAAVIDARLGRTGRRQRRNQRDERQAAEALERAARAPTAFYADAGRRARRCAARGGSGGGGGGGGGGAAAVQLRAVSLARVAIPGDGSCLFRAAAAALFGTQAQHEWLRRRTVAHMRAHAAEYLPFVGDGAAWTAYVRDMAAPCAWAGQIELEALGRAVGRRVEVHSLGQPVQRQNEAAGAAREPIRLWFDAAQSHYDLLVPEARMRARTVAQALVCNVVDQLVAKARFVQAPDPIAPAKHVWRNFGTEAWARDRALRERADRYAATRVERGLDAAVPRSVAEIEAAHRSSALEAAEADAEAARRRERERVRARLADSSGAVVDSDPLLAFVESHVVVDDADNGPGGRRRHSRHKRRSHARKHSTGGSDR